MYGFCALINASEQWIKSVFSKDICNIYMERKIYIRAVLVISLSIFTVNSKFPYNCPIWWIVELLIKHQWVDTNLNSEVLVICNISLSLVKKRMHTPVQGAVSWKPNSLIHTHTHTHTHARTHTCTLTHTLPYTHNASHTYTLTHTYTHAHTHTHLGLLTPRSRNVRSYNLSLQTFITISKYCLLWYFFNTQAYNKQWIHTGYRDGLDIMTLLSFQEYRNSKSSLYPTHTHL